MTISNGNLDSVFWDQGNPDRLFFFGAYTLNP